MKIAAVVMLLVATTGFAQDVNKEYPYFPTAAQYRCADLQRVSVQYLAALSSENQGVVESALAHVAMMKVMLPTCNLKRLKSKVDEMATGASSLEVRYKAFLVKAVFEEPEMFDEIAYARYDNADQWLGAIASRMSQAIAVR
ncbi:MAG: hypothetical protein HY961_09060 [Ignavibacteriae bacterium]|nr:hypothetical protein [Ignavibacteriota bacterium]